MRTYPVFWEDGTVRSFEISNAFPWALGPMRRILKSIDGLAEYESHSFDENPYRFTYRGTACIVNEPFGDNSRYTFRAVDPNAKVDLSPIHEAFRQFRFLWTFDREFRE
jgi:hypothetical protein